MNIKTYLILLICILYSWSSNARDTYHSIDQIIDKLKIGESVDNHKILLSGMLFEREQTLITTNGRKKLDLIIEKLQCIPTVTFEVISHTDKQSEKRMGQQLTRRRAKNVSDYLITKGIYYKRIHYTGAGTKELFSKKNSDWTQNNRLELRIIDAQNGNHQIVMPNSSPTTAKVIIIEEEQITYINDETTSNQTITRDQIIHIELDYGHTLMLSPSNTLISDHPHTKSKVEKISLRDVPKTPTQTTSTDGQKDDKRQIDLTSVPGKVEDTNTRTAKNEVDKSNPTTQSDDENNPNDSTDRNNRQFSTSTSADNTEQTTDTDQQANNDTTTTTITDKIVPPRKDNQRSPLNTPDTTAATTLPQTSLDANSPPLSVEHTADTEALLTRYLDHYLLDPKPRPKRIPTPEELFQIEPPQLTQKMDTTGLTTKGAKNLLGSTTSILTNFVNVIPNDFGGILQVVRQPIRMNSSTLNLNYIDASAREVLVSSNKRLPNLNRMWLFGLGLRYRASEKYTYQFEYNSGSNNDVRFNGLAVAATYHLDVEVFNKKVALLPGFKIGYGAGIIDITEHELRTSIFTVKNTNFISRTIHIDYRENITTLTPVLGYSFSLNTNTNILVQAGYNIPILTIGKLRFTGGTDKSSSKTVRQKLDGAGLSIDGTAVIKTANLFNPRGIMLQLGLVYQLQNDNKE